MGEAADRRKGIWGPAGEGRNSVHAEGSGRPAAEAEEGNSAAMQRSKRPKDTKITTRSSVRSRLRAEAEGLLPEGNFAAERPGRGHADPGAASEEPGSAAAGGAPAADAAAGAALRREEGDRSVRTSVVGVVGERDVAVAVVGAAAAAVGRMATVAPGGHHGSGGAAVGVAGPGPGGGGTGATPQTGSAAQAGGDAARRGRTHQARKQRSFLHGKHQQRVGTVISRLVPSAGQATLMDKKRKLYSNTSQQPLWSLRKITINPTDKDDLRRFPSNAVHNHRYSLFTFLFKNLWEQFHRVINWWFLLVAVIQSIPQLHYNPCHVWSTALPLACVLLFGMAKALVTDYGRRSRDALLNGRVCYIVDGHQPQLRVLQWRNVRVGNILRLRDGEEVPADIVVLATSNADGVAYAETAKLDGETTLKFKQGVKETRGESSPLSIASIRGRVVCEKPSVVMDAFTGSLKLDAHPRATPLDIVNLIQRGSHIRNTDWLYGVVIYTGEDTRIQKNVAAPAFKRSHIEEDLNSYLLISFFVVFLAILVSVMSKWSVQERESGDSHSSSTSGSSDTQSYSSSVEFMLGSKDALQNPWMSILRFLSVYAPVLPLSLPLVLDSIYVLQSLLIQGDAEMRGRGMLRMRTGRSTNSLSTLAAAADEGGALVDGGSGPADDFVDGEDEQAAPSLAQRSGGGGEGVRARGANGEAEETEAPDFKEDEEAGAKEMGGHDAEGTAAGEGEGRAEEDGRGNRWRKGSWTFRSSRTTTLSNSNRRDSQQGGRFERTVSSLVRRLMSRGERSSVSGWNGNRKEAASPKVSPHHTIEHNGEHTDAPTTPHEAAVLPEPASFTPAATPAAAALCQTAEVAPAAPCALRADGASTCAIAAQDVTGPGGDPPVGAPCVTWTGEAATSREAGREGETLFFDTRTEDCVSEASEASETYVGSSSAARRVVLSNSSGNAERWLAVEGEKHYQKLSAEARSQQRLATGGRDDTVERHSADAAHVTFTHDNVVAASVPSPRNAAARARMCGRSRYTSRRHTHMLYRSATVHAAAKADFNADFAEKAGEYSADAGHGLEARGASNAPASSPAIGVYGVLVGSGRFGTVAAECGGETLVTSGGGTVLLLHGRNSGKVRCMEDSGDEEIWPEVHNPSLTPNLGQVDFVFADKTGTITENDMTFSMCSAAGKIYGFNSAENAEGGKERGGAEGKAQNYAQRFEDKKVATQGHCGEDRATASGFDVGRQGSSLADEGVRRRRRPEDEKGSDGDETASNGALRSRETAPERGMTSTFSHILRAEEKDADLDWSLPHVSFEFQESPGEDDEQVSRATRKNIELSALAAAPRPDNFGAAAPARYAAGSKQPAAAPPEEEGAEDREAPVDGRPPGRVDSPLHAAPSVFSFGRKRDRAGTTHRRGSSSLPAPLQEVAGIDEAAGLEEDDEHSGDADIVGGKLFQGAEAIVSTAREGYLVSAKQRLNNASSPWSGAASRALSTGGHREDLRTAFARHAAVPFSGAASGGGAHGNPAERADGGAMSSLWRSSLRSTSLRRVPALPPERTLTSNTSVGGPPRSLSPPAMLRLYSRRKAEAAREALQPQTATGGAAAGKGDLTPVSDEVVRVDYCDRADAERSRSRGRYEMQPHASRVASGRPNGLADTTYETGRRREGSGSSSSSRRRHAKAARRRRSARRNGAAASSPSTGNINSRSPSRRHNSSENGPLSCVRSFADVGFAGRSLRDPSWKVDFEKGVRRRRGQRWQSTQDSDALRSQFTFCTPVAPGSSSTSMHQELSRAKDTAARRRSRRRQELAAAEELAPEEEEDEGRMLFSSDVRPVVAAPTASMLFTGCPVAPTPTPSPHPSVPAAERHEERELALTTDEGGQAGTAPRLPSFEEAKGEEDAGQAAAGAAATPADAEEREGAAAAAPPVEEVLFGQPPSAFLFDNLELPTGFHDSPLEGQVRKNCDFSDASVFEDLQARDWRSHRIHEFIKCMALCNTVVPWVYSPYASGTTGGPSSQAAALLSGVQSPHLYSTVDSEQLRGAAEDASGFLRVADPTTRDYSRRAASRALVSLTRHSEDRRESRGAFTGAMRKDRRRSRESSSGSRSSRSNRTVAGGPETRSQSSGSQKIVAAGGAAGDAAAPPEPTEGWEEREPRTPVPRKGKEGYGGKSLSRAVSFKEQPEEYSFLKEGEEESASLCVQGPHRGAAAEEEAATGKSTALGAAANRVGQPGREKPQPRRSLRSVFSRHTTRHTEGGANSSYLLSSTKRGIRKDQVTTSPVYSRTEGNSDGGPYTGEEEAEHIGTGRTSNTDTKGAKTDSRDAGLSRRESSKGFKSWMLSSRKPGPSGDKLNGSQGSLPSDSVSSRSHRRFFSRGSGKHTEIGDRGPLAGAPEHGGGRRRRYASSGGSDSAVEGDQESVGTSAFSGESTQSKKPLHTAVARELADRLIRRISGTDSTYKDRSSTAGAEGSIASTVGQQRLLRESLLLDRAGLGDIPAGSQTAHQLLQQQLQLRVQPRQPSQQHGGGPTFNNYVNIIRYQASSPDEECLVSAAAHMGYTLIGRTSNLITLDINGQERRWHVIGVNEFTHKRGRMSIVVRPQEWTEGSILYVKGADMAMLNLLVSPSSRSRVSPPETEVHFPVGASSPSVVSGAATGGSAPCAATSRVRPAGKWPTQKAAAPHSFEEQPPLYSPSGAATPRSAHVGQREDSRELQHSLLKESEHARAASSGSAGDPLSQRCSEEHSNFGSYYSDSLSDDESPGSHHHTQQGKEGTQTPAPRKRSACQEHRRWRREEQLSSPEHDAAAETHLPQANSVSQADACSPHRMRRLSSTPFEAAGNSRSGNDSDLSHKGAQVSCAARASADPVPAAHASSAAAEVETRGPDSPADARSSHVSTEAAPALFATGGEVKSPRGEREPPARRGFLWKEDRLQSRVPARSKQFQSVQSHVSAPLHAGDAEPDAFCAQWKAPTAGERGSVLSDQRVLTPQGLCGCRPEEVADFLRGTDLVLVEQHLKQFSLQGLRTMALACRYLTQEETETYKRLYTDACASVYCRAERLEEVAEDMERDLEYLGITGVRDKLQEEVPETLELMMEAGVRIWMVTGDNVEYALHICHSCRLLTSRTRIFHASLEYSGKKAKREGVMLYELFRKARRLKQNDEHICLVVTGPHLRTFLNHPDLQTYFLNMACCSDVVVAARVTPTQKAELVRLIKKRLTPEPITLAVGDGGNDVAMLQEAHVGVAIRGRDSATAVAVAYADYSLSDFRFLQKLLFAHGRLSLMRVSLVIFWSLFKSLCIVLPTFYFQPHAFWSAVEVYDPLLLMLFDFFFTSLPAIVHGFTDQDIPANLLPSIPVLYTLGRRRLYFNGFRFIFWTVEGIVYSFVISYLLQAAWMDSNTFAEGQVLGFHSYGILLLFGSLLQSNLRILLETHLWTPTFLIVTVGLCTLFFFPAVILYSLTGWPRRYMELAGRIVFQWPMFYILVPLWISIGVLLQLLLQIFASSLFPNIGGAVKQYLAVKQSQLASSRKTARTPFSEPRVRFLPGGHDEYGIFCGMGSLWSVLKRIFWFLGGCICYTPSPGVPLPSADQTAASPEFCAELRERFNPRRHKNVADRLPPPRRFRINENFLVYGSADDRPREGARELAGPRQPVGPAGGLASTGATRGKTGFVEAGAGSPPIINGALVQEMADIETENSLSSNGSEQEKAEENTKLVKVSHLINRFTLRFKDMQLEADYQIHNKKSFLKRLVPWYRVIFVFIGLYRMLSFLTEYFIDRRWNPKRTQMAGWMCVPTVVVDLGFAGLVACTFYDFIFLDRFSLILNTIVFLMVAENVIFYAASHVDGTLTSILFPVFTFVILRISFLQAVVWNVVFLLSFIIRFTLDHKYLPILNFAHYLPLFLGVNVFVGFVGYRLEYNQRKSFLLDYAVDASRRKQREILNTMLPAFVVDQMINAELNEEGIPTSLKAEDRGTVSVIFCDVYEFQQVVASIEPTRLVEVLDSLFLCFDRSAEQFGCTKVETVFETYLAAAGLQPGKEQSAASYQQDACDALDMALAMLEVAAQIRYEVKTSSPWGLPSMGASSAPRGLAGRPSLVDTAAAAAARSSSRDFGRQRTSPNIVRTVLQSRPQRIRVKIGIHSGRVISGVVGAKKPQYALFGDTVNTASRMKTTGSPDYIHISEESYKLVRDDDTLEYEPRQTEVKGKGIMNTYLLIKVKGSPYPHFDDQESTGSTDKMSDGEAPSPAQLSTAGAPPEAGAQTLADDAPQTDNTVAKAADETTSLAADGSVLSGEPKKEAEEAEAPPDGELNADFTPAREEVELQEATERVAAAAVADAEAATAHLRRRQQEQQQVHQRHPPPLALEASSSSGSSSGSEESRTDSRVASRGSRARSVPAPRAVLAGDSVAERESGDCGQLVFNKRMSLGAVHPAAVGRSRSGSFFGGYSSSSSLIVVGSPIDRRRGYFAGGDSTACGVRRRAACLTLADGNGDLTTSAGEDSHRSSDRGSRNRLSSARGRRGTTSSKRSSNGSRSYQRGIDNSCKTVSEERVGDNSSRSSSSSSSDSSMWPHSTLQRHHGESDGEHQQQSTGTLRDFFRAASPQKQEIHLLHPTTSHGGVDAPRPLQQQMRSRISTTERNYGGRPAAAGGGDTASAAAEDSAAQKGARRQDAQALPGDATTGSPLPGEARKLWRGKVPSLLLSSRERIRRRRRRIATVLQSIKAEFGLLKSSSPEAKAPSTPAVAVDDDDDRGGEEALADRGLSPATGDTPAANSTATAVTIPAEAAAFPAEARAAAVVVGEDAGKREPSRPAASGVEASSSEEEADECHEVLQQQQAHGEDRRVRRRRLQHMSDQRQLKQQRLRRHAEEQQQTERREESGRQHYLCLSDGVDVDREVVREQEESDESKNTPGREKARHTSVLRGRGEKNSAKEHAAKTVEGRFTLVALHRVEAPDSVAQQIELPSSPPMESSTTSKQKSSNALGGEEQQSSNNSGTPSMTSEGHRSGEWVRPVSSLRDCWGHDVSLDGNVADAALHGSVLHRQSLPPGAVDAAAPRGGSRAFATPSSPAVASLRGDDGSQKAGADSAGRAVGLFDSRRRRSESGTRYSFKSIFSHFTRLGYTCYRFSQNLSGVVTKQSFSSRKNQLVLRKSDDTGVGGSDGDSIWRSWRGRKTGAGQQRRGRDSIRSPYTAGAETRDPALDEEDLEHGRVTRLSVSSEWLVLKFKDKNLEARYRTHFYNNKSNINTIEQALIIFLVTFCVQTLTRLALPRIYVSSSHTVVKLFVCSDLYWAVRATYTLAAFCLWLLFHYRNRKEVATCLELRWMVFLLNLLFISASCVFALSNSWGVCTPFASAEDELVDAAGTRVNTAASDGILRVATLPNAAVHRVHVSRPEGRDTFVFGEDKNPGADPSNANTFAYTAADRVNPASTASGRLTAYIASSTRTYTYWLLSDTIELFFYIVILHHNTGLLFQNCILVDILLLTMSLTFILTTAKETAITVGTIAAFPCYVFFNLVSAYCKEYIDRLTFYVNEHAKTTESRATQLLKDMLPKQVLEEFQQDKLKLAYLHENVTFLFADICGFTSWAKNVDACEVVTMLQKLFAKFDKDSTKFGLYKLCTIGDAYVAVSEPVTRENAQDADPREGMWLVLEMAKSMIANIAEVRERLSIPSLDMRIGLHYGSCVGGVIGSGRLRYDLWGMDVLTGNMMESNGVPGKINVSDQLKAEIEKAFPGEFVFRFNKSVWVINSNVDSYLIRPAKEATADDLEYSSAGGVLSADSSHVLGQQVAGPSGIFRGDMSVPGRSNYRRRFTFFGGGRALGRRHSLRHSGEQRSGVGGAPPPPARSKNRSLDELPLHTSSRGSTQEACLPSSPPVEEPMSKPPSSPPPAEVVPSERPRKLNASIRPRKKSFSISRLF